jgi:hypothetical protein
MEPNWSKLWDTPQRKICTKQEVTDKLNSLEETGENYYFEYISSDSWGANTDEAYIKIKKRIAVD